MSQAADDQEQRADLINAAVAFCFSDNCNDVVSFHLFRFDAPARPAASFTALISTLATLRLPCTGPPSYIWIAGCIIEHVNRWARRQVLIAKFLSSL